MPHAASALAPLAVVLAAALAGCIVAPELESYGHPPTLPPAASTTASAARHGGLEPHISPYGAPGALFAVAPLPPGASEHAVHAADALRLSVAALERGELDTASVHAGEVLDLEPLRDPALELCQRHARFLRAEIALRRWMMAAAVDSGSVESWETSMMQLHLGWRLVESLYGTVDRDGQSTRWTVAAHVRTAHLYDHVRRTLAEASCPTWLVPADCPAFVDNLHATARAAEVQALEHVEHALARGDDDPAPRVAGWLHLARDLAEDLGTAHPAVARAR